MRQLERKNLEHILVLWFPVIPWSLNSYLLATIAPSDLYSHPPPMEHALIFCCIPHQCTAMDLHTPNRSLWRNHQGLEKEWENKMTMEFCINVCVRFCLMKWILCSYLPNSTEKQGYRSFCREHLTSYRPEKGQKIRFPEVEYHKFSWVTYKLKVNFSSKKNSSSKRVLITMGITNSNSLQIRDW